MGKPYLGRGAIGFDGRTDKKVRYRDLVEDGEIPGLLVAKREADAAHPQRRSRPLGADRRNVYAAIPDPVIATVSINVGWDSDATDLGAPRLSVPSCGVGIGYASLEINGLTVSLQMRFARKMYSFDARTGMKVRASELVSDGQVKGVWTTRANADREHPQTRMRAIPPDRNFLFKPSPPRGAPGVDIWLGYEAGTDFGEARLPVPGIGLTMGGFALEYAVNSLAGGTLLDFSDPGNSQYVLLIFAGI